MSKAVAYVAKQEEGFAVSVVGLESARTPCRICGATGAIYTVHCWREEARPIVALCKNCAVERANGVERVYVRTDRRGLLGSWQSNKRRELTAEQRESIARGKAKRRGVR